ncbi:MAG: MBOAT family protein, partial [Leptospiraceae bacterium]|nr:MBOAT family protein [Leptospiraceae bacterium]
VAGPIVTAKTFLPQLVREVKIEEVPFKVAIRYFVMGYIKKVIISDNISPIVDLIFKNPENYGTTASWLAATLFIVQIYCDFSGYSDMAFGSALLLGYELPENFRMPLAGVNFTDFWRRWHISLSGWLKEYLYIGLGGSRVGYFRHKFNLFFTMLLAGLWHGASWNFVIWGGIQGVILAAESAYGKWKESKGIVKENPFYLKGIYMFLTLSFFTLIGTLFRSENMEQEWKMLHNMIFHFSTTGLRPYMVKIGSVVILTLIIGHIFGYFIFEKNKNFKIPVILEYGTYVFLVLFISLFTNDNDPPFIYFQF